MTFLVNRTETRKSINKRSIARKERERRYFNTGVNQETCFKPGELVIVYNSKVAKQKLNPSYRGLFKDIGFATEFEKSYELSQVNRELIARYFHGNYLKLFKLYKGYLVTGSELEVLVY